MEVMRNYIYIILFEMIFNNVELVGNLILIRLDVDIFLEWCCNIVIMIWYYYGGCGVGIVVDNEYRIIGVVGIRVIDGLMFNFLLGMNF